MHALIIESDNWVILAIEDVLATLGYTTFDSAVSAAEATKMAQAHRPDLIMSAFHVGSSCGFEMVRAARAGRHIPFVFVTSTSWAARERDREVTVVQKPFSDAGLKKAVESAVASPMAASW